MSLDFDLVETIAPLVDISENAMQILQWVDHITNRGKRKRRILLVNESTIYLIGTKSFSKSIQILQEYNWYSLKRIVSTTKESMSFVSANGTLSLESPLVPDMLIIIVQYTHNIFAHKEMPEVDLFEFDYSLLSHSPHASYMRLRSKMLSCLESIPKELDISYRNFLLTNPTEIDLLTFDPVGFHTPFLLDSLSVEPAITSLIVQTPSQGPLWSDLADFVELNSTITTLTTYESIVPDYAKLVEAFKKNTRSKITKLCFIRARITAKQVKCLTNLLSSKPFEQLFIQNSLSGEATVNLLTEIETKPCYKKLSVLNLDGSKNLDLSQLLRATRTLDTLSIANCNIELCLFFGFLAMEKDTGLRHLILSGNKAAKLIKDTLTLPPSIKELTVANVIYKSDNFLRLLRLASKSHLNIDLSRAIMDTERWAWIFSMLYTVDPSNLVGLGWNENPTSSKLFDFISRFSNLESISFNGCFGMNDPLLADFADMIASSDSLKTVSVCGNQRLSLQASAVSVLFSPLRLNRSIEYFDFSRHTMGPVAFKELANVLMQNRKLINVTYSTVEGLDSESLFTVFRMLSERGTPLNIPWPQTEITNINTKYTIKAADMKELKSLYKKIVEGTPSISIPEPCLKVSNAQKKTTRNRHSQDSNDTFPEPNLSLLDSMAILSSDLAVQLQDLPPNTKPVRMIEAEEWEIVQPKVPKPDDGNIISAMEETYNIVSILQKMSSDINNEYEL